MSEVVRDEGGFVELHPWGAGCGECTQHVRVGGHDLVDPGERIESLRRVCAGLRECKIGDGADQDRAGDVPPAERVGELPDDRIVGEGDGGLWSDLGDEVVVVGVEPFGHFLRRHPRVAACQREVQVEAFAAAEALRDRPE